MSLQTVWRCHERFCFSDGTLHILVEDSLYCVHRSLFEKHANKFPLHEIDASFGDPYTLKDVRQIDFDRLLACLYANTLLVSEDKTSEEWTSILKLASKWGFESLRSRAIRKIERTFNAPVDRCSSRARTLSPALKSERRDERVRSRSPGPNRSRSRSVTRRRRKSYSRLRSRSKDKIERNRSDQSALSYERRRKRDNLRKREERREEKRKRQENKDKEKRCLRTQLQDVVKRRNRGRVLTETAQHKRVICLQTKGHWTMRRTGLRHDTDSPLLEAATTVGAEEFVGSVSEHRSPNGPSPSDASGNQDDDILLPLEDVLNLIAKFLDELTIDNFDVVSFKLLEWINANDSETLYHVTRLIVEQVVKNPGQTDVCVHLCKMMMNKVSGKIRDIIIKNSECSVISGGLLFREHLGDVCQKELEGVTVSITAALPRSSKTSLESMPETTRQPEVRRLRLIGFITQLSDMTPKPEVSEVIISLAIVEKWIVILLDAKDPERLVTLSMLLDSAGPRWDASRKMLAQMNSCFVDMTNVAQTTDNACLRTLLQDVIERRNKEWVVNEQKRDVYWFLQTKSHWTTRGTGFLRYSITLNLIAKFLDELTMDNFDVVSVKVLQLVNANDSQTLYHATRLIVKKAVNNYGQTDVCIHLCKEMVKKVNGPAEVQGTMIKKSRSTVSPVLFRKYLGEVCQEKLGGVSTSVTAANTSNIKLDSLQNGAPLPEVRRLRLIIFISKVSDMTSKIITSPAIVKKWITTLLDPNDDEKLVTLSMLLDSVGPRWDASSTKKLKARMNSCFVEMTNIARQRTRKARVRNLLQNVIERRNRGWVVNETAQHKRDIQTKSYWTKRGTGLRRHDSGLPTSKAATTVRAEKCGDSVSEHRSPNALSPNDASGSQDDNTHSSHEDVLNMLGSTGHLIAKFLDELTMDNFDVVSVKILQWVNGNSDSQKLYHVTRLIVEKAVKNHGQTDVCIHLCKMMKNVSGKIRDTITKKLKCTVIAGGPLFCEHLGEACQKKLEDVTVSITVALARSNRTSLDTLPGAIRQPKVRRLRLIRFIKQLSDLTSVITSRVIVEKWIATLLYTKDAERLVTLSMLLDSAGPCWDASTKKLKALMKSCFVEMAIIAKTTDNTPLRTLLQNLIERRNKGWVVNETTQQCRSHVEKRRASCSLEDEPANEQPKVETMKTSKGGDTRSGKKEMMLASSYIKPLDDEKDWFAVTGNRLRSIGPVVKGVKVGWLY